MLKISLLFNDSCHITCQILIRFDDCDFQYQLRLGDVVMGTAIESRCDGYEWRVGCVVQQYSADWSRLVTQGRQKVKALTGMVTDKNGITITSPIDFGFMDQGENRIVTACIR